MICRNQVAMGQGQADIAMQQLHDCARNGMWLCLKNLHLVTAWLPTLEKVTTTEHFLIICLSWNDVIDMPYGHFILFV